MKPILFICLLTISIIHSTAQSFDQKPVIEAALRFSTSLSEVQKIVALRPMNDTNRIHWSNLPLEQVFRDGLRLDLMTDDQRQNIHQLLRTVLSDQGYLKILFIMQYDQETNTRLTAAKSPIAHRYGQEKYWTWIFGNPSLTEKWGFKFEGHHISLNLTFSPKGVSCTPHFTGINPGLTTKGITSGKYIMYRESEVGKNLFKSLTEAQRQKAHVDTLPFTIDVRTQTGKETLLTDSKGLSYIQMNKSQQLMILDIINAWADNFNPAIVANKKLNMLKTIASAHFTWLGSNSIEELHYYSIIAHGWVIEFADRDQGLQHFHTIWRMMPEDFGSKL
jgi:Protein of unknown function (DUF3500)